MIVYLLLTNYAPARVGPCRLGVAPDCATGRYDWETKRCAICDAVGPLTRLTDWSWIVWCGGSQERRLTQVEAGSQVGPGVSPCFSCFDCYLQRSCRIHCYRSVWCNGAVVNLDYSLWLHSLEVIVVGACLQFQQSVLAKRGVHRTICKPTA